MFKATDIKKEYNTEWINSKWLDLKNKSFGGRFSVNIGKYSVDNGTVREFERQLKQNGFSVEHGYNSHNVPRLIITW